MSERSANRLYGAKGIHTRINSKPLHLVVGDVIMQTAASKTTTAASKTTKTTTTTITATTDKVHYVYPQMDYVESRRIAHMRDDEELFFV